MGAKTVSHHVCSDSDFIPDVLWRYVKPSWINREGDILPVCFDLRAEKDPPETYVSFHEGEGSCETSKLRSAIQYLLDRNWELARTGKILSLLPLDATEQINTPTPIVKFQDARRPHFGMTYLVADDALILEAKNLLAVMAELHSYDNCLD